MNRDPTVRRRGPGAGSPARPERRDLVPLVALRCTAALIAVLLGAVVWNGSPWLVLPVLVAAGAAFLPSLGLVTLSLLLLVVSYAVNMPAGSAWLLVFVAGLHAVFVLYLLLLQVPARGWVSVAALGALAASFLRIQLLAQPVALLALLVDDAGSSLAVVVTGVVALAAWVLWILRHPGHGTA